MQPDPLRGESSAQEENVSPAAPAPEHSSPATPVTEEPAPLPPISMKEEAPGSAWGSASGRGAASDFSARPDLGWGGQSLPRGDTGPLRMDPGRGGSGGGWIGGGQAPQPQPQPSWRKRHPVLFWGGLVFALLAMLRGAYWVKEEGPMSGPRIGVVRVEGLIAGSSSVVQWIEKLRRDPNVKGVVLRINSPGGGVGASQEIYMAVKRLTEAKPVVASMGAVAASGGYYIALGAKEIYAMPSTLTASIGVKLQLPNAQGLMKMIGLSSKTLTTGALKDAGAIDREMTPEEEAYFQALIGDMYDEFVSTIAAARSLSEESVRSLADGRAMTGRQALQAKLIDGMGDMPDALRRVRALAGIPDGPPPKLLTGPEKPSSLLREVLGTILEVEAEQRAAAQEAQFMY